MITHINSQNDLVYLNINFFKMGSLYFAAASKAYETYLNYCLDDEFYKALEKNAIELVANAGNFDFAINAVCLSKNLSLCLEKIDFLLNGMHKFACLEKIKTLLKNEFQTNCMDYDYLAKIRLCENAFGKGFKNGNFGDFENLCEANLIDFQKALKQAANNITITAKSPNELLNSFYKDGDKKHLKLTLKDANSDYLDLNLTQAFIRFLAPLQCETMKERAALSLGLFALGGGFGSRITEEIRVKRGLAYSAFASMSRYKDSFFLASMLQTKHASKDEAIKIVQEEITKFYTLGISEEEFAKTKTFFKNSEPLKYNTQAKRHAIAVQEINQDNELGFSKKLLQTCLDLELDECNEIIKNQTQLSQIHSFIVL